MTAENAQREPTMEEILASIRRIISEDDKPADTGGDVLELKQAPPPVAEARPVQPAAKPAPAPPVQRAPAEEILDEIDFEPEPRSAFADRFGSDDAHEATFEEEPQPAAFQQVRSPPKPMTLDTLVGEPAATRAAGSLGKLMGSMQVATGNTLDDVVRDLLKPMLKEWLDENLPSIVESEVAREIERIRRMAR
ncbi:MAG: DUF2497 domain-containing protein [Alphaproteobacteria bacterium]|nr:DUF2497 domain-containing protein [Alphaproteobacteria bacterium]